MGPWKFRFLDIVSDEWNMVYHFFYLNLITSPMLKKKLSEKGAIWTIKFSLEILNLNECKEQCHVI